MSNYPEETVALTFRKGHKDAAVVTNGKRHAIYTASGRTFAPSLHAAIAKLEAQGFNILIN